MAVKAPKRPPRARKTPSKATAKPAQNAAQQQPAQSQGAAPQGKTGGAAPFQQKIQSFRLSKRLIARPWTARAVARVATYAAANPFESRLTVFKAVSAALGAAQSAVPLGQQLLDLAEFRQNDPTLSDITFGLQQSTVQSSSGAARRAFDSITNAIPPAGVLIDTAVSWHNRLLALGAIIAPEHAAEYQRSLELLQHEAQESNEGKKLAATLDTIVDAITKGLPAATQIVGQPVDAAGNKLIDFLKSLGGFIRGK